MINIKKSFLSKGIIALILFVLIFPSNIIIGYGHEKQFSGGAGTEDNPWRISTPEDLDNLRNYLGSQYSDSYFVLTNDIDLSDYLSGSGAGYNDGAGWKPIMDREYVGGFIEWQNIYFQGSLNGNGYKISNLFINRPDESYIGLFGGLEDAEIISLGVEDISVTGRRDVGGLAGSTYGSTIINNSYGSGEVISVDSSAYTGGLVGSLKGEIEVYSSYFIGNVNSNGHSTGGLAGYSYPSDGTILIDNCYSIGEVDSTDSSNTGGLVGYTHRTQISNSFFQGNVEGLDNIGGLVGGSYISDFENNSSNAYVTGRDKVGGLIGYKRTNTLENSYAMGEVNGRENVGGLVGSQANDSYRASSIINSYSKAQVSGSSYVGGLIGNQSIYSGTEVNVISSYYDSNISGQSDTGKGEAKTSIDMKTESTYEDWNFGSIWDMSVGKNDGYPYLNTNITIEVNPANSGEAFGSGGHIQGKDVTVIASVYDGYRFSNWSEAGTIISRDLEYSFYAAGDRSLRAGFGQLEIQAASNDLEMGYIIGGGIYSEGQVTLRAMPYTSYSFVNWTEDGVEVSTDESYTFIAEEDRDLIANFEPAYYIISVGAYPNRGGAVEGGGSFHHGEPVTLNAIPNDGYSFVNWTENGTEVSDELEYSFLAVENRNLTANFGRYDIITIASPEIGGTTSGDILTDEGETVTVTAIPNPGYKFVNWTEDGVEVSTEEEYTFTVIGAHTITANFTIGFGGGDGSEGDPYIVSDPYHLNNIRHFLNDTDIFFKQNEHITLDDEQWSHGEGWQPIGGDGDNKFQGSYDGNGYRIENLTINRPDTDFIGLFGFVGAEAEVKNIILDGVDIQGKNFVGALGGALQLGAVTNSYASGDIKGNNYIGGLVGANSNGTISNSGSRGTVAGLDIDDRGISHSTGGLVGLNDGTIEGSYSKTDVLGTSNVGGLAGANESPKTIINSYATGSVTGESKVGGLVGSNTKTVINSFSVGPVSGNENVGGLIGDNSWGTVESSYYDSQTSSQTDNDRGTPLATGEMMEISSFIDWDYTNTWEIDENMIYPRLKWEKDFPSSNGDLSEISLSHGELDQGFASEITEYTASVENSISSITITPTAENNRAIIRVNGSLVNSGDESAPISLAVGSNTITIKVIAQDGTEKAYYIIVTRAEESNNSENPNDSGGSRGGSASGEGRESQAKPQLEGKRLNISNIVKGERVINPNGNTYLIFTVTDDILKSYLDNEELEEILIVLKEGAEEEKSIILPGNSFNRLKNKGASFIIDTEEISFFLPGELVNIEDIGSQLNDSDNINLKLRIALASSNEVNTMLKDIGDNSLKPVTPILSFSLEAVAGDRAIPIISFGKALRGEIRLSEEELVNVINPRRLNVYRYNSNLKQWEYVRSIVDEAMGKVVFFTNSFSNYAVMESNKSFTDIVSHWGKEAIEVLAGKHIMNGYEGDEFRPNNPITRAEFSTILVKALGLNIDSSLQGSFKDVGEDSWYYKYVNTANQAGLIQGFGDGRFRPNAPITREQMAVMIIRGLEGFSTYKPVEKDLELMKSSDFEDYREISPWAKKDMSKAVEYGIIKGITMKSIKPSNNTTRAQGAAIILKLIELLQ